MIAFFQAHTPLAAMLLAGFFLWCYIVVASVEFGATLFILFPKLRGPRAVSVAQLLSPVWEVNNVFLVGFFVSLLAFFPGFIPWFATALFIPLSVFIVANGVRVLSVLIFFYSPFERIQQSLLARLVFATSAYTAMAAAAWGATVAIIGVTPELWLAQFAWLLVPAVLFALAGLAAFAGVGMELFGGADSSTSPVKMFTDFSCVAYAASAVWFFKMVPLFAAHNIRSADVLWTSVALALALALAALGRLARRPSAAFFALAALVGILIFYVISLQYPYLVYPFITAASAYTATSTATILFIVCILGLVLVIPSLAVLYTLFLQKNKSYETGNNTIESEGNKIIT